MLMFKECLDDCGLSDLGYSGPKFTWTNKQESDSNVRVRLDRAVANGSFTQLFDDCHVENVITTTSDHYAIVLSLKNYQNEATSRPVQMGFKYEAAWLRSPDYNQVLEAAWNDDPDRVASLQGTWSTLHRVATSLAQWSKDTFNSVRKKIQKLERRLKSLRLAPWDSTDTEAKVIELELCGLFEREEVMARQRSRVEWLKEGDRNTAFFHARASARRWIIRLNP
jgi:hypothetical protein